MLTSEAGAARRSVLTSEARRLAGRSVLRACGAGPHACRAGRWYHSISCELEGYKHKANDARSHCRQRHRACSGTQRRWRPGAPHLADRGQATLLARPGRAARARRHRGAALPRRLVLAPRRLSRRRGLLRHQRLPYHRAARLAVAAARARGREGVLDRAREKASSGALPGARRDARLRANLPAERGRRAARGRPRGAGVRHQLVPRLRQRVVLRGHRPSVALEAPVVARGRGTVLPGVAAGAGARAGHWRHALSAAARPGGGAPRRHGVRSAHGRALHARGGPFAPLLRNRHEGGRSAPGRRARVRLGPVADRPGRVGRREEHEAASLDEPQPPAAPLGMDRPDAPRRRRASPRSAGWSCFACGSASFSRSCTAAVWPRSRSSRPW